VLRPFRGLGGRLGGVSRLSRGFQLGDALGEGHEDRVLAAGFVLPVFDLPAQVPYLIL
jgi:hypothetical protein